MKKNNLIKVYLPSLDANSMFSVHTYKTVVEADLYQWLLKTCTKNHYVMVEPTDPMYIRWLNWIKYWDDCDSGKI